MATEKELKAIVESQDHSAIRKNEARAELRDLHAKRHRKAHTGSEDVKPDRFRK